MEKSFQFRVDLEIIHQTWSNVLLLLLFSNHNMYDLRRLTWWYSEQAWKTTTCTQRIKTEQADYFWQTFHTTYHKQNSKVLGLFVYIYIFFLILALMPVQSKSLCIYLKTKNMGSTRILKLTTTWYTVSYQTGTHFHSVLTSTVASL